MKSIFEGPVDRGIGRMKGTIRDGNEPRTRDLGLKEMGEGRRQGPSAPRAASWAESRAEGGLGANDDAPQFSGPGHRPQCPSEEFHTCGDERERQIRCNKDLTQEGKQGIHVSRPWASECEPRAVWGGGSAFPERTLRRPEYPI